MHKLITLFALFAFCAGCSEKSVDQASSAEPAAAAVETQNSASAPVDFASIFASRPESEQARIADRHPQQTLEFFDIQPGMNIAEILPGKGWYSSILIPLIGNEGTLIGVDYNPNIWEGNFPFANEGFLAKRAQWSGTWPQTITENTLPGAKVEAYTFATVPDTLDSSVDRVLFVRALHHLFRTEDKGGFLTQALSETMRILKPEGLIGVVQHQSPESADDTWANGSAGYLKKSAVIRAFEDAGFEFVSQSSINENPRDNNPEGQIVWRLPPSYRGAETEEQKSAMREIGESNRMTLLFKKP